MNAKRGSLISLKVWILALFGTMTYSDAAHACVIRAAFRIEDVVLADAVFVGELVNYQLFKPRPDFDLSEYAVLTFIVQERLRGKSKDKRLRVHWRNSTYGMPSSLRIGVYLVAVTTTGRQPPLRFGSATIFPSSRPDLPSVLQAPCADAFLLEPTSERLEEVRSLLSAPPNLHRKLAFTGTVAEVMQKSGSKASTGIYRPRAGGTAGGLPAGMRSGIESKPSHLEYVVKTPDGATRVARTRSKFKVGDCVAIYTKSGEEQGSPWNYGESTVKSAVACPK